MGDSIPVFFFPIERRSVPGLLRTWEDASDLIEERYKEPQLHGLRQSVSRNWWHQLALESMCMSAGINGLEFVSAEVACVRNISLPMVIQAIDKALLLSVTGIPSFGENEVGVIAEVRLEENRDAVTEAQPSFDVSCERDSGHEAVVGFWRFIKSLRESVSEAFKQGKDLIYVAPHPS